MSKKILILGDVHLGKSTNLGKNSLTTIYNSKLFDQIKILDFVLDEAIHNMIENIFITGDIFEDPKPDHEIINEFAKFLKSCEVNSINVHIILGNHDYLRIDNNIYSPLDIFRSLELSNVHIYYSNTSIFFDDVSVTLLPFVDRKYLKCDTIEEAKDRVKLLIDSEIELIPKFYTKLCIGHLALENSIFIGDEISDITNEIIVPLTYFNNFDYVWMGHVHKYQELNNTPFIGHIGSMDVSDFGEVDESKYIIIFDIDEKIYEKKKIPTTKLKKIVIDVPEDQDYSEYVKSALSNFDLKDLTVKVEINYGSENSLGKNKISKFLENSGANSIKIVEKRKPKLKDTTKSKNFSFDESIESNLKKYAESLPIEIKDKFLQKGLEILSEIK
ncbi:MAG: metallophosphoesterase [Chitinophagales bacterium]|nr:metallophosphoesterase [Chitinophagales bacterium]